MAAKKKEDSVLSGATSEKRQKALGIAQLIAASVQKHTEKKPVKFGDTSYGHIPSGSMIIDCLIGGGLSIDKKSLICPGYPRRRITEIYGKESSGKTTLALTAAANCQRSGGTVMYLDFEHSIDKKYAQKIGVVFDETFAIYQPATMEEGLKMAYIGIRSGVDLIIVDSVAAFVPKAELEKPLDEFARIGAVAASLSNKLPKFVNWLNTTLPESEGTALVLLNQERATINTGGGGRGGPTSSSSGGSALKYYCSVRILVSKIHSEYVERKDLLTGIKKRIPYGNVTNIKIVKNKLDATAGQIASILIRKGIGVDDVFTLIETAVVAKIVKKQGSFYQYGEKKFQGRDKFKRHLLDTPSDLEVITEEVKKYLISVSDMGDDIKDNDKLKETEDEEEDLEIDDFETSEDKELDIEELERQNRNYGVILF